MPSMLDAAQELQASGLAVFPLKANRGRKLPATPHGFKDASTDPVRAREWWRGESRRGIGVATGAPSGGVFVIDVDTHKANGYAALEAWEKEHGNLPETATAKTGGGGLHLSYKGGGGLSSSSNKELGIDVRANGGYAVAPPTLHDNGNPYEWANDPMLYGFTQADRNVLAFVKHVQKKRAAQEPEITERHGVIGEGGRNEHVFRLACELCGAGLLEAAVMAAVEAENAERCSPPLPTSELRATVKSACSRDFASRVAKGKFSHVALGQALVEDRGFCFIDGVPTVWNGERYEAGGPAGIWQAADRAMIGLRRGVTASQRREVRDYLLSTGPHFKQSNKSLIAFENGVLDLGTGGLRPMTKNDRITNLVPHRYEPSAKSEVVESFLNDISCGDEGTRASLEEIAGLCLYRGAGVGKAAFLVGNGANGKSVYIEALKNLAGAENCSFLDPRNMARNAFQLTAMAGKTANFCDDLSIDALTKNEIAVLKTAVTGGELPAEVKGGATFSFAPIAFHAFAGNAMPRFLDRSKGLERRLHIVVFGASFTPGSPGFDPNMSDKLQSEEAAQALAVLAVTGLRRALAQHALTSTERGEARLEEVRRENSPVYRWCMEETERGELVGKAVQDAYDDYLEWSRDEGLRSRPSRRKFSTEVSIALGLRTENNGREPITGRKYRTFEAQKA